VEKPGKSPSLDPHSSREISHDAADSGMTLTKYFFQLGGEAFAPGVFDIRSSRITLSEAV
jgi:hypothetical protein